MRIKKRAMKIGTMPAVVDSVVPAKVQVGDEILVREGWFVAIIDSINPDGYLKVTLRNSLTDEDAKDWAKRHRMG